MWVAKQLEIVIYSYSSRLKQLVVASKAGSE